MIFVVEEKDKGKRLDTFLQEKFPDFSRSNIQNNLKKETAFLTRNGKKIFKAGETLRVLDEIVFEAEPPKEINVKAQKVPFEIVYQDCDLAVVNKPQGVVVHPCNSCKENTLVNGLLGEIKDLSGINGELRPGIVHRIDKNTCGLLLVAKNDFAHIELSKQIAEKTCKRKYLALIEGTLKNQNGRIETFLGRDKKNRKRMAVVSEAEKDARLAITEYETKEYFKNHSLVEFSLKTGRTHQIRVHAKHLNHPIVGDIEYGGAEKFGLTGQFLCAYKIEFVHPRTKEAMAFEISLPENFEK